jgi:hypothetical protein
MQTMKLNRFNRPEILKQIGRDLLSRFFASFQAELAAAGLALPPPGMPENDYYTALAWLLLNPERLPDSLNEALFDIEAVAHPRAFSQLEASARWADLRKFLKPDAAREEMVLQAWLEDPRLVAGIHNSIRLRRLSSFQYAATRITSAKRPPFVVPDKAILKTLTAELDRWFAGHNRGHHAVRIEMQRINGEFWFLTRHGDIYTRTPKVEEQHTEILHFRPERDDVVVYSPERDDLRINSRAQPEREMYIRQFGLHLRGRTDYFSWREPYTLEPLRTDGAGALNVSDIDGLVGILLRELEVRYERERREVITRAEQGLFAFAAGEQNAPNPIPQDGRLVRAIFEIQFAGRGKPRPVEIRVPNVLRVSQRCDSRALQNWLIRSGIRNGEAP